MGYSPPGTSGVSKSVSLNTVYMSIMNVALRGELMEKTKFIARLRLSFRLRWIVAVGVVAYVLEEGVVRCY